jgi:hypothetical protein
MYRERRLKVQGARCRVQGAREGIWKKKAREARHEVHAQRKNLAGNGITLAS